MITPKAAFVWARSAEPESLTKDNAPIALANSAVQTRAYDLYELRGRVDVLAEQD